MYNERENQINYLRTKNLSLETYNDVLNSLNDNNNNIINNLIDVIEKLVRTNIKNSINPKNCRYCINENCKIVPINGCNYEPRYK